MAHEIIIDFVADGDEPSVSRVRNFGEELYRTLREDGWASISLDDIDRATDQLRVKVFSRARIRRTMSHIQTILKRHYLVESARLSRTR